MLRTNLFFSPVNLISFEDKKTGRSNFLARKRSQLMRKHFRPETSLLRAETRLGLPHLSLSYCRQLHSGLACLGWCQFVDERSFQCPLFILCILPIMAVYWWIQHFYRLTTWRFRGEMRNKIIEFYIQKGSILHPSL